MSVPTAAKSVPAYSASAPESQILKANNKTPFRSEAEMMSKLGDALSDFE